jgi:hypothetical protein
MAGKRDIYLDEINLDSFPELQGASVDPNITPEVLSAAMERKRLRDEESSAAAEYESIKDRGTGKGLPVPGGELVSWLTGMTDEREGKQAKSLRATGARKDYESAGSKPAAVVGMAQDPSVVSGQGAPLSAGPGAEPDSIMTQEVVSGNRMDPELQAQYQEASNNAMAARQVAAGYQGQLATMAESQGKQMSMQRLAMDTLAEKGVNEARQHMAAMAAAYDEAALDMDSMRVDPKRWEQDTPALAQVLMAIGSAAFSFFTKGQGVNPITSLIENAIDRDVAAQTKNIELRMRKAGLGMEKAEMMNKLQGNIHSATWNRALNAYEQMLQQGNLEMQGPQYAAAAQEMMAKASEAHAKSYEPYIQQYQQSFVTPEGANYSMQMKAAGKGMGSQKWDNSDVEKQTAASLQGLEGLDSVWSAYKRTSEAGGPVGRVVMGALGSGVTPFTTDEGLYNQKKGSLAIMMAKATAGFQVSEADRAAFESIIPLNKDTRAAASGKMLDLVSKAVLKLRTTYQQASPQDRARIEPSIQRARSLAVDWLRNNPDVIKQADDAALKQVNDILGL